MGDYSPIKVSSMAVDYQRVFQHKKSLNDGNVIYRVSRDQRVDDNWALLFAQELADKNNAGLAVVFTLMPSYLNANSRSFSFMVQGLVEMEQKLLRLGIPFHLLETDTPTQSLSSYILENRVTTIVTDFDPLRIKQQWISEINEIEGITHYEVDAHNIVPCRIASSKAEFGAYTIRPKIKKQLNTFLTEFPLLHQQCCFDYFTSSTKKISDCYAPIPTTPSTFIPGEKEANRMLSAFIKNKISDYTTTRNNPSLDGQSNLSPYLHFGQISAQRVALNVLQNTNNEEETAAFLEELIVRKELADNFCFYTPHYDSVDGFPTWAKKDHEIHRYDKREYLYTLAQLEQGLTHDSLWNAAQNELTNTGKMHGYMRMYWAKKILEWTASVEDALATAIFLNDRYSIDGRDANGYAGIAWSIGGVHDRAWFPRPIYGKIRYMSYNGCKSKFDISSYILKNSKQEHR